MTLQTVLLLGAALAGVGIYGVLAMGNIVMIMMGLELAINGVIVMVTGLWYYTAPTAPDGQILVMIVFLVMAIEAAMGFAVALAIYRVRQVEMIDMAGELSG